MNQPDTSQTRDIHPVIDEIVGFGIWRLSGPLSMEERYRPPDPHPFVGGVTAFAGSWDRWFGIVARVVGSHAVVISPVGTTYWWNVGTRTAASHADVLRYRGWRSGSPPDLKEIARDMTTRHPPPCECPDTPVQRTPDDGVEWDVIGLCERCSCHWCRVFPTGDPLGPEGSTLEISAGCDHILIADGLGTSYTDYLERAPTAESIVRDSGSSDPMISSEGDLHREIRNVVRNQRWLTTEVARLFPGREAEYESAWHVAVRDVEIEHGDALRRYRERYDRHAPWLRILDLE